MLSNRGPCRHLDGQALSGPPCLRSRKTAHSSCMQEGFASGVAGDCKAQSLAQGQECRPDTPET